MLNNKNSSNSPFKKYNIDNSRISRQNSSITIKTSESKSNLQTLTDKENIKLRKTHYKHKRSVSVIKSNYPNVSWVDFVQN